MILRSALEQLHMEVRGAEVGKSMQTVNQISLKDTEFYKFVSHKFYKMKMKL